LQGEISKWPRGTEAPIAETKLQKRRRNNCFLIEGALLLKVNQMSSTKKGEQLNNKEEHCHCY
jgi:hypothetical protein